MAKIIDLDIVLPVIVEPVQPNTVDVGTPEIISVGSSSIEVSQSFSSDVDYYGGIYVGESADNNDDATLVKNPGYLNKTITGLTSGTTYYVNGVGIPVLGNITVGEQISVTTKQSPIPDEYQLVEYLEGNGTQYIYTGLKNATYTGVKATVQLYAAESFCFGCYDNTWLFAGNDTNRFTALCGNNSNDMVTYAGPIFDKISFSLNYLNDNLFKPSFGNERYCGNAIMRSSSDIFLFCYNVLWNRRFYGKQQIYEIHFSLANQITRSFYPVYRKADNKPGMYDIVENQFYVNQGTDEFIVGPDKEWDE